MTDIAMTPWRPEYGRHIRELRRMAGLTLRQFCAERGINPAEWSALERGRGAPETAEEARRGMLQAQRAKRGFQRP